MNNQLTQLKLAGVPIKTINKVYAAKIQAWKIRNLSRTGR